MGKLASQLRYENSNMSGRVGGGIIPAFQRILWGREFYKWVVLLVLRILLQIRVRLSFNSFVVGLLILFQVSIHPNSYM